MRTATQQQQMEMPLSSKPKRKQSVHVAKTASTFLKLYSIRRSIVLLRISTIYCISATLQRNFLLNKRILVSPHLSCYQREMLLNALNKEVTISDWRKGDGNVLKTRDMSYIKPLNGSIGMRDKRRREKNQVTLMSCVRSEADKMPFDRRITLR